jgi:hypothetical protein
MVRHTMAPEGVESWVAEEHLEAAASRRVALARDPDVFTEVGEHQSRYSS